MKLETGCGRRIAYDLTEGAGPGVVFLGGFRSTKEHRERYEDIEELMRTAQYYARARAVPACASTIRATASPPAHSRTARSAPGPRTRGRRSPP